MSAMENLNNAVNSMRSAHSNLFSHVQLHVAQSASKLASAGSDQEAAIQTMADNVNNMVAEVQAEIAKIPVVANV